jgi:hypothetical protein
MLMRTPHDFHYESFSTDYGTTWSKATPSRFSATITMPTIQRLRDGRILLLWNNTVPLPETAHDGGYWEDVFTNRDVLHGAISEDDGKTWKGFREIYLNPLRNKADMATFAGKMGSLDRSVHQTEFVQVDDSTVLISLGQHPKFRKLMKLNLNYFYQNSQVETFEDGLQNWTYHKYIAGIKGHCAYNRKPGAFIQNHDNKNCMHIKATVDSELLSNNSGALYNFNTRKNGILTVKLKLDNNFKEGTINLLDKWFNPTDSLAKHYAQYRFDLSNRKLLDKNWHQVKLIWNADNCKFYIDEELTNEVSLKNKTVNGISYIHFFLPCIDAENGGVYLSELKVSSF